MFRKAVSFGGLLLLAGATVLVTPGLGEARGGGGHGGGGHGGGFHGGGHFGGYRGGSSRGDFYGHSYGHSGYRDHGGYYPYYGGYYLNPDLGDYVPYGPYSYSTLPVTDDSGYSYGSVGDVAPPSPDGTGSATAADTNAHVTVRVPAGARVSFGGTPTTSTGPVREYQSPPLAPGLQYTYEIQASWNENGQAVTQTQKVEVTAGGHVSAAFPISPAEKR